MRMSVRPSTGFGTWASKPVRSARARSPGSTFPVIATSRGRQSARDARTQRIFDIAYHKCEYVGDATGVRERHIASQQQCLKTIEAAVDTFHDVIAFSTVSCKCGHPIG